MREEREAKGLVFESDAAGEWGECEPEPEPEPGRASSSRDVVPVARIRCTRWSAS